ncbi:hypothetical protein D9613_003401 [Agrocybe pediades]|uniref:Phosphomethylpyrimidine kinase n=1 Tax=Agrocybe pediades TaxID=84607 RepID=A0A8H4QNW0_9AGAR|nr:hypothetical protein D9613_003401 [Agrocybe pediades]
MSTDVVLTIAGSDSSGGAGIQADLKTFAAHGCYGASVITALTAQNTLGVQGVHACPPDFVRQQLDSVLDDLQVRAIKTGMLCDAATAKTVVDNLTRRTSSGSLPPIICDPVCVSTSGHTLLKEDAVETLITGLFPISALITPNKSEAELLASRMGSGCETKIDDLESMLEVAKILIKSGCKAVLLKGGHLSTTLHDVQSISAKFPDARVIKQGILGENMEILLAGCAAPIQAETKVVFDLLYQSTGQTTLLVRPRIESSSTHGTGCTLSSAVACELAKGAKSLEDAVASAAMYTHLGILAATAIGQGYGPLNHLHSIQPSLIYPRSLTNPYPFTTLLIQSASETWRQYVEHDFVKQLGRGTLDRANFIHFIKQDYLYLKYYARAYGLLAAKSTSFNTIRSATDTIYNVLHEIGQHKTYCSTFGISEAELEDTPEASATTAYGAYLMDTGDSTKLVMALMACLLGYGEVGLWLKKQSSMKDTWVVLEGNPYKHWVEEYAGEMYQGAVRIGLETMESLAVSESPSEAKLEEWKKVWKRCTMLEKSFWDMAMDLKD